MEFTKAATFLWMNLVHSLLPCFLKIHFNTHISTHVSLDLLSSPFPSRFPPVLYAFLFSATRNTFLAYPIFHYLSTEEY